MAAADVRTCSICIEQFKEPKLLPCFHSFCLHCLQHYVATSVQDGTFNCPVCRYEVTVPKGGVSAFQTNFYIEAEADRQAYTPSQKCDVCSNPADRKCLECSQLFCKSCTAFHSSLGATRSHTTITLGEVEEDSAVISRPQFCVKHRGEVIRFYCRPCEKPICRDCKLTSHEGHKTVDLCDLVAGAKSSLATTKAGFEECIETVDANLRLIDVQRASLENARVNTCASINKVANKLMLLINQCRASEMEAIDAKRQIEEKDYEAKRSELLSNKRCLHAQIDHMNMILSTGLDGDVITTANEVRNVLERVKDTTELGPNVIRQMFRRQWVLDVFGDTIKILASNLRTKLSFNFTCHSIDVIGPLSNFSGAWIGCTVKGRQNCTLSLVSVAGEVSDRVSVHMDRYELTRMDGLNSFLPSKSIGDNTKTTCEKCESNIKTHEQSNNSVPAGALVDDVLPRTYSFCGKQTPMFDQKENGDFCKIDIRNRCVDIWLADGRAFRFNVNAIPKYKNKCFPRDVCWGSKQDIFVADCGINLIHHYDLVEGLKQSFVLAHPAFSPTAVAMDNQGQLWIGEANGRISVFHV